MEMDFSPKLLLFNTNHLTMKRNISLLFIGFSLFSMSITSCSETDANETTEYYCPMKCEGEKTYTTEVPCPVCGMDLKGKKLNQKTIN